VVRALEYLDQAVVEAEAAARWYAERSPTASARFSAELDEAEAAILERPEACPSGDAGTRRYLLRRFPFGVVYRVEDSRILIVANERASSHLTATASNGHTVRPTVSRAVSATCRHR
jgi:plasmid stabilization system protein ParE